MGEVWVRGACLGVRVLGGGLRGCQGRLGLSAQ